MGGVYRASTAGEAETVALAARFAGSLRAGDVVALRGELGAGKTRFVRGLCEGLGIAARVSSPTYVLVHEYGVGSRGIGLVHVDAYRLGEGDDVEGLDWARLVDPASGHVLAIEWPGRIEESLPDARFEVTLAHEGEARRGVEIVAPEGREIELDA